MRVKHCMGMSRDKTNRRRGAVSNPTGRYEKYQHVPLDDGWGDHGDDLPVIRTTVQPEQTRTITARNDSPDVPFDRSINPYEGCEHGCIHCFARVTHAYLGLSPGIDFESRFSRNRTPPSSSKKSRLDRGIGAKFERALHGMARHTLPDQSLPVSPECGHPAGSPSSSLWLLRCSRVLSSTAPPLPRCCTTIHGADTIHDRTQGLRAVFLEKLVSTLGSFVMA